MLIASLIVYPIKSCGGVSVDEAVITRRGLASDRLWMVVDEQGKFLSQRNEPRLMFVRTRFEGDAILVTMPGSAELRIPRHITGPQMEVQLWRHPRPAVRHDVGSTWFSAVLGRPVSLVHIPDGFAPGVEPAQGSPGDIASFADAYPVHLTTEESLSDLVARLGHPVAMGCFRPNVVVRGAAFAYDEDSWLRVALDRTALRVAARCGRCVVTTIDPVSGVRGKEPLRTLATYRTDDGSVYFGVYLVPEGPGGVLRVGDPVAVLERSVSEKRRSF
jgi:uncharacterized protein YcbX